MEPATRAAKGFYSAGKTFFFVLGRFAFAFGTLHVIDNYIGATKQVS